MRKSDKALFVTVLLSFAFSAQLSAQESPSPKGKVATVDNHTGNVWLSELSKADDVFDFNVAHATFAPADRSPTAADFSDRQPTATAAATAWTAPLNIVVPRWPPRLLHTFLLPQTWRSLGHQSDRCSPAAPGTSQTPLPLADSVRQGRFLTF